MGHTYILTEEQKAGILDQLGEFPHKKVNPLIQFFAMLRPVPTEAEKKLNDEIARKLAEDRIKKLAKEKKAGTTITPDILVELDTPKKK